MNKKELIKRIEESTGIEYHADDFNSVTDIIYSYYIDAELFTEEETNLVTNINGYNEEALNDMLFARYGYRDLEQML